MMIMQHIDKWAFIEKTRFISQPQSDLKFTSHIYTKIRKPRQQLGMIKRRQFKASEKPKLLAYIGLCRPRVKYASADWDPNLEYIANDIEMAQHNAIRFIFGLEGRDGITSALESFELETLAARRGKTRHSLLPKLLTNKKNHNLLINAYEDLMDTRATNMPTTGAAARGDPALQYMLKHQHTTTAFYQEPLAN